MGQLPAAPVERIIRENGLAQRVSTSAAKLLAEVMEEYGTNVALRAVKIAGHAGRKTVTAEDIRLAAR